MSFKEDRLKGRLRTDTITFFRDSNCLLSYVLHFQRESGYVSGPTVGVFKSTCVSIVVPVVTLQFHS